MPARLLLQLEALAEEYVNCVFCTEEMVQAYCSHFLPVMKQDLVPVPNRKAPLFHTQPGRPKKRCIPSKRSKEAVVRSKHGKATKVRGPATCSSCGGSGNHYAPTCRGTQIPNAELN